MPKFNVPMQKMPKMTKLMGLPPTHISLNSNADHAPGGLASPAPLSPAMPGAASPMGGALPGIGGGSGRKMGG